MFRISSRDSSADPGRRQRARWRAAVFLVTLVAVTGSGLVYTFARDPIFRATARLSVDPPSGIEDPLAKTQFVLAEAQVLRGSKQTQAAIRQIAPDGDASSDLERNLSTEVLPQTNVIELRAEGHDRTRLVAALHAWIGEYLESRKTIDREDGSEALEEARHAAREADKNVEAKRREMEAFRQRHGIASIERDENPGAARLKGLHLALNDAAAKEVNAEGTLKAIEQSIAQGKGVVRNADKPAIANLEMRAVDLREKLKDLEHDYTAQYLAHEPRYKALRANLARVEQQVISEKERSQKAALVEAHEQHVAASRASQKLREQIESSKQETQAFSTRFAELKRMAVDLDSLQDARKQARDHLSRLESARKPNAAKIRVLATPSAGEAPVAPDYARDAAIALAAGVLLAIGTVWLADYLRREDRPEIASSQPVIQIAYPVLGQATSVDSPMRVTSSAPPLIGATASLPIELAESDVAALWRNATPEGRIIIAALLSGVAPDELVQLRWRHVSLEQGIVDIPGSSGRRLNVLAPLRDALRARAEEAARDPEAPVLADAQGSPLDQASIDSQLRFTAHDAGLRHPEEVTARSLHFTYAAFLARQGMRMTELANLVGRLTESLGAELMRLSPPGRSQAASDLEFLHPGFRAA